MIKKLKKEQLLIGGLFGLLLAVIAVPLPEDKKEEKKDPVLEETPETVDDTEERLERILGKISGVGKVEVLMTYEDSGRVVVEKDEVQSEELIKETDSSGGSRTTTTTENQKETVYGSGEAPYVVQQIRPQVEGVLVVAEGGGSVSVKRQIRETIKALFGIEAHKISIMKMEVSK